MADYTVVIRMNRATVESLSSGGFNLYGLKAVVGAGTGAPLVWFRSTRFAREMDVQWQAAYQAYTSMSPIVANGKVEVSASYGIGLGQTLTVTASDGTGSVAPTGVEGAISIQNWNSTELTCGISQEPADGRYSPVCAFPLYGMNIDVIAPVEKVFLMLADNAVNLGTVVYQAYSAGVLIDLTGVQSREVSYDVEHGWSWAGSASWARAYPANSDLVPLLIVS
jgi:hypothetical protein